MFNIKLSFKQEIYTLRLETWELAYKPWNSNLTLASTSAKYTLNHLENVLQPSLTKSPNFYKMGTSLYLQALEPWKTHNLEGCHLLELPNEGGAGGVVVVCSRKEEEEKWGRSRLVSCGTVEKQGRTKMGKVDCRLSCCCLPGTSEDQEEGGGSWPYIGMCCGPHHLSRFDSRKRRPSKPRMTSGQEQKLLESKLPF